VRARYSSVGEEMDFSNFTLWFSGTSFSCPYTAGMAALILEKFGDMSQGEMYSVLKKNSVDIGDEGLDTYHGWGVPVMPDIDSKFIKLQIGSNLMMVNGEKIFLDTEPIIDKHSRTLVPVRAIAESLGCNVEWEGETKTIFITR
jgi:hypothetical protein